MIVPQPRKPIGPDQLDHMTTPSLEFLLKTAAGRWVEMAKSEALRDVATFWQELGLAILGLLKRRKDPDLKLDDAIEGLRYDVDFNEIVRHLDLDAD